MTFAFGTASVDGSRVARAKCDILAFGRVQTSVRPVDAVVKKTAGPDGVRELGPALLNQAMMPWPFAGLSRFPV